MTAVIAFSGCTALQAQYSLQAYSFCAGGDSYLEIYTKVPASQIGEGQLSRELFLIEGMDTVYGDISRAEVLAGQEDFFDLHRVKVKPGQYQVSVKLWPQNQLPVNMATGTEVIACTARMLSDFIVAKSIKPCAGEPACKYDMIVEPVPGHILVDSTLQTRLYGEYYHQDPSAKYISYGVQDATGQILVSSYKAVTGEDLQVLRLPISADLPSFERASVFVSVHDALKNTLYSTSTTLSFDNYMMLDEASQERMSMIDTLRIDDLIFDLKSLVPIIGSVQAYTVDQLVAAGKPRAMRRYLKRYWTRTYGADAAIQYGEYRSVALAVHDRFYNTVGYGIETDRGYIYLKYGKPNDMIVVEDEPDAPPYQIWRYNYITGTQQSNVKFIFYNPSLVTNDYYLLHSTCRGELQNPRWEVDLYSKAAWDQTDNTIDVTTMSDGFNRQARRLFDGL